MLDQRLDHVGPAEICRPLEGAEPDMAVRQPHQNRRPRRRRLIAAFEFLARLDQGEGPAGRHALRLQHLRRQDLAHAALQRQASVPGPRPGRLPGPFCSQVEKSTWGGAIARGAAARCLSAKVELPHLRREEAPPVAEVGIVGAELMPVIAHRDRAGLAGQGLETTEMGDPLGLGQRLQPHGRGGPVIADAQDRLRKVRRPDRIAIVLPQIEEAGIGGMGGRDGHPAQMRSPVRRRNRRTRLNRPAPRVLWFADIRPGSRSGWRTRSRGANPVRRPSIT